MKCYVKQLKAEEYCTYLILVILRTCDFFSVVSFCDWSNDRTLKVHKLRLASVGVQVKAQD